MWERTAFVELNSGFTYFTAWFQDLFCSMNTILKDTYKMVSTNHVLIALIPFTRDFQHLSRDENIQQLANNLLSAALLMNDVTNRCPEIQYHWVLLEPPLLPSQQVVALRCAAQCRELNLLNDPNYTPARIWNMTWSSGSSTDNDIPCVLPNRKSSSLDRNMFSRDRRHISKDGYAIWL